MLARILGEQRGAPPIEDLWQSRCVTRTTWTWRCFLPSSVAQIVHYFLLERAVLGKSGVQSQVILFTGVLAGTIGRWLFLLLEQGSINLAGLGLGVIASIVTFPMIYHNAGLDKVEVNFVKWCVAFQNGYFWPVLLEQIGKTIVTG